MKLTGTVLAFTTDGWTSRAVQHFISLTIHYMTQNFKLHHYMLNFQHLPTTHTHRHIQDIPVNSLTTWGINTEKQAFFTSDNGANVVKAINTRGNWTRIPCFAHCLQLAIKTGLKKYKQYEEIRKKCRAIVAFFARSTFARETFVQVQKSNDPDKMPLQLVQEVDTRWNSTYLMFHRFSLLETPLNIALSNQNMPENLNPDEWTFLKAITTVLEPMKEVTDLMSGDLYTTMSQYYPMYIALLNVLQPESTASAIITAMCNNVRDTLKVNYFNFLFPYWLSIEIDKDFLK